MAHLSWDDPLVVNFYLTTTLLFLTGISIHKSGLIQFFSRNWNKICLLVLLTSIFVPGIVEKIEKQCQNWIEDWTGEGKSNPRLKRFQNEVFSYCLQMAKRTMGKTEYHQFVQMMEQQYHVNQQHEYYPQVESKFDEQGCLRTSPEPKGKKGNGLDYDYLIEKIKNQVKEKKKKDPNYNSSQEIQSIRILHEMSTGNLNNLDVLAKQGFV